MNKLSVVLATRNEKENIKRCLKSVDGLAHEIVVVDESSEDNTRDIARKLGAKVFKVKHEEIFHKTKQKALDLAKGDWILQLDADEVVSEELAKEIKNIVKLTDEEIANRNMNSKKKRLFDRHQHLLENRDGKVGKDSGEVAAFFLPRKNYFLGKPLMHGGAYPDGVIRLVKKGKARFPSKSVHEQIEIDGQVSWLENDLEHHDSPTLARYITRLNRYTDLHAKELESSKLQKGKLMLFYFTFVKPTLVFLKLYFRHKGFLDGMRGFLWSFFSASHHTIAYYKFWEKP